MSNSAIPLQPCLTFDNDISGIGVRTAIYAQNFLVFFPVLWNIRDGYISISELKSIEKQSVAILIIAFAILVSTIVQARSFEMNSYHAALVLDLSWMNNVCTFVWFMLYLHHKTKPTPLIPLSWNGWKELIGRTWDDWVAGRWRKVFRVDSDVEKANAAAATDAPETKTKAEPSSGAAMNASPPPVDTPLRTMKSDPTSHLKSADSPSRGRRAIQFIIEHLVLILGSLHLSLMASVGILLWIHPERFGHTDATCPVEMVILGQSIPLASPWLRAWSLLAYSILLIPGVNLVIPFAIFLIPHVVYNQFRSNLTMRTACTNPLKKITYPSLSNPYDRDEDNSSDPS